jgi:mannose-6-phosphate isomerase-like protein (cupin superfamily)
MKMRLCHRNTNGSLIEVYNMKKLFLFLLLAPYALGAERTVDPTFLHRYLPDVAAKPSEVSTDTCHYKPLFGKGDAVTSIVKGVARFGEIDVDPQGTCAQSDYPGEEQIYVILEGSGDVEYGGAKVAIHKDDFAYFPPGAAHAASNGSGQPLRLIVMGFKVPTGAPVAAPAKLQVANINDVKQQTVAGHPDSVLYRLLVGDRKSTRDKIAAGQVVTSLFIMEFAPGGTNFPHHHDTEEEIYLVLDGHGEMVADGGLDGIEGRHPARAGDAYFFRLNCTVGFYNSNEAGAQAHILAVRSLYPFSHH